jgi:hypothetical protein
MTAKSQVSTFNIAPSILADVHVKAVIAAVTKRLVITVIANVFKKAVRHLNEVHVSATFIQPIVKHL